MNKLDSETVDEIFVRLVAFIIPTDRIIQIQVERTILGRFHLTKIVIGFETIIPKILSFFRIAKKSSEFEEDRVDSSKPLKSVFEKKGSRTEETRTEETSFIQKFSTSSTFLDANSNMGTGNDCHIKKYEDYGRPLENFGSV